MRRKSKNSFYRYIKSNFHQFSIYSFIFGLIIIAIHIRTTGLSQYYLTLDDTYDMANSSYSSLWDFLKHNLNRDNHPLLARFYLWVVHFFTSDYMTLRWVISIIPCIFCIPLYYYIGKKHDGSITGVVMAWVITFGQAIVLFSQTLRQYSIFIFALGICFYFLLQYFQTRAKREQYLFLLMAFISLYIHYQTVILLCAAAAFITLHMIWLRRKFIDIAEWVIINLIILLSLKLYVTYQLTHSAHPSIFYIYNNTPTNIAAWFNHFLRIFDQFLLEQRGFTVFAVALFLLGSVKLLLDKKYLFLLFFVTLIAVNVVTEFTKNYPFFTMTRRIMFYLPFVAYIMGAGLTVFYLMLKEYAAKRAGRKYVKLVNDIGYIAIAAFFLIITYFSYNAIKPTEFYRTYGEKNMYFMLHKSSYDKGMQHLAEKVAGNDILFVDGLTANYFIYLVGRDRVVKVSQNIGMVQYANMNIFFNNSTGWERMDHPNEVRNYLTELAKIIDLNKIRKIWYVNFSWDTALLANEWSQFPEINKVKDTAEDRLVIVSHDSGVRSVVIYSMRWKNLKNILNIK